MGESQGHGLKQSGIGPCRIEIDDPITVIEDIISKGEAAR